MESEKPVNEVKMWSVGWFTLELKWTFVSDNVSLIGRVRSQVIMVETLLKVNLAVCVIYK